MEQFVPDDDYEEIDFSDEHYNQCRNNQSKNDEIYNFCYDDRTVQYYRALRLSHVDPILDIEVPDKYAFKFPYKWDPYTGERIDKDQYGSLYFDPDSLIKHFWSKRLENLWYGQSDDNNGYFEGYYGDAIGNGPLFNIKGRGAFPQWDIFRLPIIDCYLTKDNSEQNITFGPRLTDEEINEIYNISKKKGNSYYKLFNQNRPDILKIKYLWDIATSSTPPLPKHVDPKTLSNDKLKRTYIKINYKAVEELKNIEG